MYAVIRQCRQGIGSVGKTKVDRQVMHCLCLAHTSHGHAQLCLAYTSYGHALPMPCPHCRVVLINITSSAEITYRYIAIWLAHLSDLRLTFKLFINLINCFV